MSFNLYLITVTSLKAEKLGVYVRETRSRSIPVDDQITVSSRRFALESTNFVIFRKACETMGHTMYLDRTRRDHKTILKNSRKLLMNVFGYTGSRCHTKLTLLSNCDKIPLILIMSSGIDNPRKTLLNDILMGPSRFVGWLD